MVIKLPIWKFYKNKIGNYMGFKDYLNNKIAHGKCYFTMRDAVTTLSKTKNAVGLSIAHFAARNEIISPAKGFYVIISPEYKNLGCIPAEQFIPYLMEYLGHKYYAALLTAASYYGSSHQAPQVFQVITESKLRPIVCGRVKIQFIKNQLIAEVPIALISTPKSRLAVSTPEATVMDLLRFPKQSGGLNTIITIISELKEVISEEKLKLLVQQQPGVAWKQRLGYIFELINAPHLADIVKNYLNRLDRVDYILLNPNVKKPRKNKINAIWKIIENVKIESDI
jgi:predicted transcriptional regulator of viral defense system